MLSEVQAGGENLARLKSGLRRSSDAMAALFAEGLSPATIERLHLGLKAPYRPRADDVEIRDALCFPLLGEGYRPLGRYAYRNIAGVTANPQAATGWGPGATQPYRLGSFDADAEVFVCADVLDCWLAWQMAAGTLPGAAFMSRTHPAGWPVEWASPGFWQGFSRVVVMPGEGAADFLRDLGHRVGRPLERLVMPAPYETMGGMARDKARPRFDEIVGCARPWSLEVPRAAGSVSAEALGRFAADPIRITGAFRDGCLYYPFVVEHRGLEEIGGGQAQVVQAYSTTVLRSDGALLTTEALPAPRGTPVDRRVMALSDGTRVEAEPLAPRAGSWSFASMRRFVAWRTGGGGRPFRPLPELLADVEDFLRSRVWLPVDGHYLLAAGYAALSHVYQVFDAIPLLLVCGPTGTGKSELGEALARVSFNATVAGQLRAAGMIRLLDETHGLLVLDDMDGTGSASVAGTGEFAQAIKTGYKRATARKPIADRGGRVRMVDFYGPKVIGNTTGADPVLGSRMLGIATADLPAGGRLAGGVWSEAALSEIRDELHCWAMASAADVDRIYRSSPRATERRAEIEAPLMALVQASGDLAVIDRMRAILDCPSTVPPLRQQN